MANMSYCRFQNTSKDLDECIEAIRNRDTLSEDELKAAIGMIDTMEGFLTDEGLTDQSENFKETLQALKEELNEGE